MTLPRAVRAVVFDMDGLLVDSEAMVREVMHEVSRRRGLTLPEEVFLRMVGLPGAASRTVAVAHFGDQFDYDAWNDDVWKMAHGRIDAGVSIKTGATELLDLLDQWDLPRAVATSSGHPTVSRQLSPSGLFARFDAIVANGDYARGKPHPDPFLVAAARLRIDPAYCLALEDSHNGVRAAHAAGMMTVMVPDLLPATLEMRALCVAIAPTLHDVRNLILGQGETDHEHRRSTERRRRDGAST